MIKKKTMIDEFLDRLTGERRQQVIDEFLRSVVR